MKNIAQMELVGIPVIFGRKTLTLPPPVVLKADPPRPLVIDQMATPPVLTPSNSFGLYSDGRLVATTTRFKLVRDGGGKVVAVRLFKNQTELH